MPRKVKNLDQLDGNRHLMGSIPDHEIAEKTGTTIGSVGRYRRKYGIKAYRAYKNRDEMVAKKRKPRGGDKVPRKSKIGPHRDLLGQIPDQEIAQRAGVSLQAVRMYRRRHGIALEAHARLKPGRKSKKKPAQTSAPPTVKGVTEKVRRRRSKLDPFWDVLGTVPDAEVAKMAGVTPQNARAYRFRHNIAAVWRAEKKQAGVARQVAKADSPSVPVSAAAFPKTVRRRRSKLDPYWDVLGTVPDAEVAVLAGVTAQNVRAFRVRHQIETVWRAERVSAVTSVKAERVAPRKTAKAGRPVVSQKASPAGIMRGFSVSVSGRDDKDDYVVMAANITEAVTQAVKLIHLRHPGAMVTGVYHLGELIS